MDKIDFTGILMVAAAILISIVLFSIGQVLVTFIFVGLILIGWSNYAPKKSSD